MKILVLVILAVAAAVSADKDFFCVDFDKDYREKVYYSVDPSCKIVSVSKQYSPNDVLGTGLSIAGKALLSSGTPCGVEIPYFQGNQFNQFTFCGMFIYHNQSEASEMGLVFNGYPDDAYPGSIKIVLSDTRTVTGSVMISGGTYYITSNLVVAPYVPHKVCFKYDGRFLSKSLELAVDGQVERLNFLNGLDGLTVPKKHSLHLGESMWSNRWWWPDQVYPRFSFVGILDTWCFTSKVVDETYFL